MSTLPRQSQIGSIVSQHNPRLENTQGRYAALGNPMAYGVAMLADRGAELNNETIQRNQQIQLEQQQAAAQRAAEQEQAMAQEELKYKILTDMAKGGVLAEGTELDEMGYDRSALDQENELTRMFKQSQIAKNNAQARRADRPSAGSKSKGPQAKIEVDSMGREKVTYSNIPPDQVDKYGKKKKKASADDSAEELIYNDDGTITVMVNGRKRLFDNETKKFID